MSVTTLLLASALASASAFVPSPAGKLMGSSSVAMCPRASPAMKVDGMVGDIAPLGFWDPLKFTAGKSSAQIDRYREAELKHGRVAMAAFLGFIVQDLGFHPLYDGKLSSNPTVAVGEVPLIAWFQILAFIGAAEWLAITSAKTGNYKSGDLLGTAQWVDNTDEGWVRYQQCELSNGRLAMLAIMGLLAQCAVTGEDAASAGFWLFK